ncbi:MAG: dihydrofolate reductase [Acidobacteriota bacterium]|jgi:dihydrofolate reductase
MSISIIAAMGTNRVIGRGNGLPWNLPADTRFFKETTRGHPVIMGRKTFDTMGKPLPGRRNIVITRRPHLEIPGAEVVSSLEAALSLVNVQEEEVFIIGGSEIYEMALAIADRMYLTLIHESFEGDTFFPEFDESDWVVVSRRDHEADERNPHAFSFLTYERSDR